MRILIGFNGSGAAMAALHDLRYSGFPDGTEALILTIAESWSGPKTVDEATSIAELGKAAICREFPNWNVTARTASGSPPREILACTESFKPDLIIVGEPFKEMGDRNTFIGHTSQTILNEADCSCRISRRISNAASHPERILVGFDGSIGAIRAVRSIATRNWSPDAEVRLLAVADSTVLSSIGRFTPEMNNSVVEAKFALKWAETLAAASLEDLRKAGIQASVLVKLGHPKHAILETAENWTADAIFVGPHCAANSFERFLIGSVSAAVASRSTCSVEVVRTLA